MNKSLIVKALIKAQRLNLGPEDSADMIETFLEVAGLIQSPPPLPNQEPAPHRLIIPATVIPDNPYEAPPIIGRVITSVKDEDAAPWTVATLSKALEGTDWKFTVHPEGQEKPVTFRGNVSQIQHNLEESSRGLAGIRVDFKCVEIPLVESFPIFFPITDANVDPAKSMEELKLSLSQLLRKRDSDIQPSTKQTRTSYPDTSKLGEAGFA